jgi:hypothetical protein
LKLLQETTASVKCAVGEESKAGKAKEFKIAKAKALLKWRSVQQLVEESDLKIEPASEDLFDFRPKNGKVKPVPVPAAAPPSAS